MIPIKLSLAGFLSYLDPVELDFTSFDLACISGANGAGKSSLLDAITWALFGQARRRDEAVIHNQASAAEVSLEFEYEANRYRVQRISRRGKTGLLEFQIWGTDEAWKPLTERTLRDTQQRIEETLRLDYETFINAAFFLQGKADQFTQQRPGDRKRILASILGLEIWETYRKQAAEDRRAVEEEIARIDGRLQEILAELSEEAERKARLKELQAELARYAQARTIQETHLETARRIAAQLAEREQWVASLARALESAAGRLSTQEARLGERQAEQQGYQALAQRAAEIQASYQAWQQARQRLEEWEAVAARFREEEKGRQAPLIEINAARARLEQEAQALRLQQVQLETALQESAGLQMQQAGWQQTLELAQARLERRAALQIDLQKLQQQRADAMAENPRLYKEMKALEGRINELKTAAWVDCPVCGKPLSPAERQGLIDSLTGQGTEMGDRYRINKSLLDEVESRFTGLEGEIAGLGGAESEGRTAGRELDRLSHRLEQVQAARQAWEGQGQARLAEIQAALDGENEAPAARARLAEVDQALKAIGYDAAAHDQARQAELSGRGGEAELRRLEQAQAALAPLAREVADLQEQVAAQRLEVERQQADYAQAAGALAEAREQAPDLGRAERDLLELREQENRLRVSVGAAEQKVLVLEDLRLSRDTWQARREELARQVSRYKQLERAFGKDGVPALLIEQALPQIELKANEILDRLSGGSMSVRFLTQAAFKDQRREDRRETLDIQISDSSGTRDYEMYSGGEAFRVNFALRLALSEVLAQRAGARLRTLVIDEGFGSQDALGRQRLIEAINLVRRDFAKILVITHIDELKDAFPTRIEVQKTPRGSLLSVQ
jgi:exonuclease SbcC